MYLLGVLCMVGLTVALPVLPDPPKLPSSTVTAHQNQKFHVNIPKKDTASPPVRYNNKEVKKDNVKTNKVSIPPPPELPPFDYSTLIKQKQQKARFDDAVEPEVERSVAVKDIKPIEKPVEVVKKEFKPIENYKFQQIQPNKESKPLEEPKPVEEPKSADELQPIEDPTNVEEPRPAEELLPIEEPTNVEEPRPAEELLPIEEPTNVEEPQPIEEPIKESTYVEEPKSVEEPKTSEEPKTAEEPKSVEELIPIEEPTNVEEPQPIEEPIKESTYVEEPKSIEEPKTSEEPKTAEEPKSVEEPKTAEEPNTTEEPKAVENLDSSKLEPKEDPEKSLEDIPVVIQFTIPITTFFSSIFSKLPSLSSFGLSWPFHKPSIFSRPRLIIANDEIYPY